MPSCELTYASLSLVGPPPTEVPSREITHVYARRRDLHLHFHPRLLHCSLDLLLRRHLPLRDRGALRPPERYGFIVANLVDPTT